MTDADNHSSLLRRGINYGRKKFYITGPSEDEYINIKSVPGKKERKEKHNYQLFHISSVTLEVESKGQYYKTF